MSSILEAANRARIENERIRMAVAGELGPAAQRAEQDRAWCHRVSVRMPISMWEVERLLRWHGSKKKLLRHLAERGCTFPDEIHAEADRDDPGTQAVLADVVHVAQEAAARHERMAERIAKLRDEEVQCIYRGKVSDNLRAADRKEIQLNLPDGRSVMVPIEVREDGIYALFPQSVIDLIEDARREDRERRESMLIFGTPEPPERYAYTSPVMEALPRTPRAAGHRITGKRAQRRMSKPWAGRRA